MVSKVRTDYLIGLKDETGSGTSSVLKNLGLIGASAEGLKGLLAGLAGGLSLAGVVAGLKSVVDLGDDFRDLSKQFQSTVEQVSALSFVSGQSGTSVETLAAASAKLSKNLLAISQGGGKDAAAALKLIGVNAADLQKADFATQLGTIADGLNRIENPSQRAAASQALFGRGARQLASLLSEGSAGIDQMYESLVKVGGVLTTEQGDKFDALNDSLGLLKASAIGTGAAIAEKLTPSLTQLFTNVAESGPKISIIFSDMSLQMSKGFLQIQKAAAEFNLWVENGKGFLAEMLGGRSRGSKERTSLLEEEIKILKEQIKSVENESQDAFERQIKEREALLKKLRQGTPQSDFENGGTGDDKAAAKRADQQKQYIDNLRQQFIVINDTSQRAKVLSDTLVGSAQEFSEETKQQALALADGLDFLKETTEVHEYLNELANERKKTDQEITAQYNKERAAIIENLQTPLEKYVATIQRYRTFNLDNDTFQRGVAKANEQLLNAQKNTAKTTELAEDLGLTFTSAFEDAVIEMRNFGDVFEGLIKDMARAILRQTITKPFTDLIGNLFSGGGTGGSGGGTGGGLLSQLGTFLGGLFANSRGGLYRVSGGGGGERPVAFTARDGEYVAVGTAGAGGEGGGVEQINIYQGSEPVRTRKRDDGRVLDIMIGNSFGTNVEGGRMMPYGIKPALTSR